MSDALEIIAENPVAVFTSDAAYSEFYQKVKAQLAAFVPDVSTAKGRDEIKSMAYKVTRSKTAIDAAGKALNEEARERINAVDAQRRKIRAELDDLAAEVRKPLTEWEAAEEARQEASAIVSARITYLSGIPPISAPQAIADAILELEAIEIDAEVHREVFPLIVRAKSDALASLSAALSAANQREADRAELEQLRRDKEERDARDAAERARLAQIEADRLAKEAADKAEADRKTREAAEREAADKRIADEAAEAARAVERKAAADALAAKEAELFAERLKREEAEAAERKRLDDERRERDAEAQRAADRAHRSKVMKAAKEAIMTCGSDEETARKIVLAIIAGEIPNVRMSF